MGNIRITLTSFDTLQQKPLKQMEKISKRDIQTTVKNIIQQALASYDISNPSTKTKKLVKDVSKRVSSRIKKEVKKRFKENRKAATRESKKNDKVKKITSVA